MNRSLNFSFNWNNKLQNSCYTTVRIWNENKYVVGERYDVFLEGKKNQIPKKLHQALLLDVKKYKFEQFSEYVARIDTGYNLAEFKEVVKKMYPQAESKMFGLYLFEVKQRYEPVNAEEQTGPDTQQLCDMSNKSNPQKKGGLITHEFKNVWDLCLHVASVYTCEIIHSEGNLNETNRINQTMIDMCFFLMPEIKADKDVFYTLIGNFSQLRNTISAQFRAEQKQTQSAILLFS